MEVKKILVPFSLYEARNAEHYGLYSDIFESIPQELAEKYHLTPIYSTCVNLFGIENDCHLRNQGYKNTEAIEQGDKKRDDLMLAIAQTIEAFTRLPIAEKAEAAKRLNFLLKPYRNVTRLPYAQESANIRDFVLKMAEEANAADIETLGLTEMMTLLDEANQAFMALYKGRSGEIRVRSTSETMKTIRPKVDAAFAQLFDAINGMYIVNELTTKDATTREELGKVIDDVNSYLIQLQKTLIRAGVIGGKVKDEGDDEPTPEPEPVTPEITAVYQKEGGDPENPNRIERGEQTGVNYKGFTLKGQDGTLEHVIGLVNDQDYIEWINPETITNVTETSCEFTMVPDLTEGQYKVRIETYDGGSPLVVEYPEPITLW